MAVTKKQNVEHFMPYVEKMLAGHTLQPDEHHDRQALARIADGCRSVVFVPVETVRLAGNVVGYRMTEADRRDYYERRAEQLVRQQHVIEHAQNQRDARRAKKLFARLGLPLPPEVEALANARLSDPDKLPEE
ncbi:hypothetical protein CYR55_07595 [Chimaeribacter californicus]|uniref:Uncharacterized protein n=1 Tax=Chimaeribacter californicus TaxID=2060067 RepID=A0A2N5ECA9_9GAMM|nr:hypothetical protein [Chimaeribacter californicus]PLR39724.1 hypothetical protein CYR55_07595 [Chimaeribacter californicus]